MITNAGVAADGSLIDRLNSSMLIEHAGFKHDCICKLPSSFEVFENDTERGRFGSHDIVVAAAHIPS